jgi:hypothetical protein
MERPLRRGLKLFFNEPTVKGDEMSCVCVGWRNFTDNTYSFINTVLPQWETERFYLTTFYKVPVNYDPIGHTRQEIQDTCFAWYDTIPKATK